MRDEMAHHFQSLPLKSLHFDAVLLSFKRDPTHIKCGIFDPARVQEQGLGYYSFSEGLQSNIYEHSIQITRMVS